MASLLIHFTSLYFTHSLHSQPAPCGAGIAGGGGRWREDMASGGEGCGTERARLAQGGSSAERARLAQGKNLQNFHLRRIRYF